LHRRFGSTTIAFVRARIALLLAASMSIACASTHPCVARHARKTASPKLGRAAAFEPPPSDELPGHVYAAMACEVDPCQDFYGYACNGYLAGKAAGRFRVGGFGAMSQRNLGLLHGIVVHASDTKEQSHERQLLGTFFDACMARDDVDAPGLDSLRPWLLRIDSATTPAELMAATVALHQVHVSAFFGLHVGAHPVHPTTAILAAAQPHTPLPIENLRGQTPEDARYRAAYRAYLQRLLAAVGVPPVEARARSMAVLELEQELARRARSVTELERLTTSGVATFNELAVAHPSFPWLAYADAFGFPRGAGLALSLDTRFLRGLDSAFSETELLVLQDYLRIRLIDAFAFDGSGPSRAAARWFYQEVLREIPPEVVIAEWVHCVDRTSAWLPEPLAQYYVQLELPPETRASASDLALRVQRAFGERISQRAWLPADARAAAFEKLRRMDVRVGHPDRWRDYGKVELDPHDHLANILHLSRLERDLELESVGRTIDREEWLTPPAEVNALYSASTNTALINAGILQWPMFRTDHPMVMNYGAIGTIIGHEIAHGFDAHAIHRDATGRHREWLLGEAKEDYDERVQCIVRDLDHRVGTEGMKVRGDLVRDEAIADLAGVTAALRAWSSWNTEQESDTPAIPGLTDAQAFFVAFAQMHCEYDSEAFERFDSVVDTHADAGVRVNATLSHVPEFSEAYACEPGTPMHPRTTCEVW
jgi:putative endopeptidase